MKTGRAGLIAALLLANVLAVGPSGSSAAGDVSGPQRPAAPPVVPARGGAAAGVLTLSQWFKDASAVDSARVRRLELQTSVDRDSLGTHLMGWTSRVRALGHVGRPWIDRFMKLLADTSRFDPKRQCLPSASADGRDREPALAIEFVLTDSTRMEPGAFLLMREDCIQLAERRSVAGSMPLGSSRTAIIALLREALPSDSTVAAIAEKAPPDPTLDANGLPTFGEYIFVEELPEAIEKVAPNYPNDARRQGVEGMVLVQALVGKDGLVKDCRVTKSIHLLDDAALKAVRQWRFKPAISAGKPVAVWVAIPVKFTLR